MVLNDFKEDVKRLCLERGTTQARLGADMGLTRQVIDKRAKNATVTKGLIEICEELGYDIEVRYVKR